MECRDNHENVSPEEFAEARRYAMQIEWSPEDQVFVVSFPDAPGVMTHGATREEAATMGEDAIISWLTALRDAHLPVPSPSPTTSVSHLSPGSFRPDQIRAIRRQLAASQRTFADLLNVSVATVRAWEQGARTPDGAATRLLRVIERHPEAVVDSTSHSERETA
jgi:DNA-binding transcriptional regulator YiaG